jgi:multidrug efflux pump subunit AcrA (membrane-fusion protein)
MAAATSTTPQLWVYAPATVPNQAPTALALNNPVNAIAENSSTVTRVKVPDVAITDDGIGTNTLAVSGPDAEFFEVDSNGLYETRTSYGVTVVLDDPTVGGTPNARAASRAAPLSRAT